MMDSGLTDLRIFPFLPGYWSIVSVRYNQLPFTPTINHPIYLSMIPNPAG